MINVKDAVTSAFAAVKEFYSTEELVDLILEEVELSEDENTWNITLSFKVKTSQGDNPFAAAIKGFNNYETKYKKFVIDAESGSIVSMTIRQV